MLMSLQTVYRKIVDRIRTSTPVPIHAIQGSIASNTMTTPIPKKAIDRMMAEPSTARNHFAISSIFSFSHRLQGNLLPSHLLRK